LNSAKVSLTDSPTKKISHIIGEKVQIRNLYVLKDEYLDEFDFNLGKVCINWLLCFTTADILKKCCLLSWKIPKIYKMFKKGGS
jgi:hypothetical protein